MCSGSFPSASTAIAGGAGAVYAITNAPAANAIVVYEREGDGALTPAGCIPDYLYVRVAALAAIAVFRVASDGSLTPGPSITGTPAGLAGLAAF